MAERKVKKEVKKETKKEGKQKACKEKTDEKKAALVYLDTGEARDLNADLDYTWDEKLTLTQKRFIFYYAYPFRNSAYDKGAESARRAGYSEKTAKIKASELLKEPCVSVEIKKFRAKVSEKLTKINIFDEVTDIVRDAMRRRRYKVSDYYDIEKDVSEEGHEYTKATPKPLSALTEEQKELLEGVEYNQRGIPNYKLPNRREYANDIVKIYKDIYSDDKEESGGFNVSTVYDLIKGKIETKVEEIKKHREKDSSDFCYTPPEALLQQER